MLGITNSGMTNLEWKGRKVVWEEQDTILLTIRDANEIIQLEQNISDNKLKNILLRTVSHELRTPINAISFLTDTLCSNPRIYEEETCFEKLKIISVSAKLLLSLVNDLLDYSRMLSGAFLIQKSFFHLSDVISSTTQLIKIQAEKKGLKVIIRIDPDLPCVIYSDPLRLSQILLNLLSNALKFTLKGFIEICFIQTRKGQVKVMVSDTGIGIEKEKLSFIFKEFNTQISSNMNPQGCGLGLHISNRIANELGGRPIKVKSQQNVLTNFYF